MSSNRLRLGLIGVYIFISHVILPVFNDQQDFLFFSSWSLFSFPAGDNTVEITGSRNGETIYFFRDLSRDYQKSLGQGPLLYETAVSKDIEQLRERHKENILQFCRCEKLQLVVLQGTMAEHILRKKDLPILEAIPL